MILSAPGSRLRPDEEDRKIDLIALILAGGSGTRFWPVSRRRRPKQLVSFQGQGSLLRLTVERVSPLVEPSSIWIATTRALVSAVQTELPEVPAQQVLGEPVGRNTAAAIGWAVRSMPSRRRDAVVVVLPSDHWVAQGEAFRRTLEAAVRIVARDDRVLALGVQPRWAETGYGYLELGETVDLETGLRRVARFTEKPELATATEFVRGGRHLWNAGIFVFRGAKVLDLLERHQPELAAGLEAMASDPAAGDEIYAGLPDEPIDIAVMEKLEELFALPLECGWNDLGSWQALEEVLPEDGAGNHVHGDVVSLDARDNVLYAEAGTLAVLGVQGLVVVRTGDSVLVIPKERAQDVRRLVADLEDRGRGDRL